MQPESSLSTVPSIYDILRNRIDALSSVDFERAVRGHLVEVFGPFEANGPTPDDFRLALYVRAEAEWDTALGAYAIHQGSSSNATDQAGRNRLQRAKEAQNRLQRARQNYKIASRQRSMIFRIVRRWIEK